MINIIRHVTIFDALQFNNEGHKIDVIGCGAIGSYIARSLSKLGISPYVKLWDYDSVEDHNIPNQAFNEKAKGCNKAKWLGYEAAVDGNAWEYREEKYEGQERLGDYVFLCVDSMEQRSKIFDENIKYKNYVKMVTDCRIDPWIGRIYTLNPSIPAHVNLWDANMYPDTENNNSLCGTKQTLGPTAQIIANMAVLNFIKVYREENKAFGETVFSLNRYLLIYNSL